MHEQELHIAQGAPEEVGGLFAANPLDQANRALLYDDKRTWTVETYSFDRLAKLLLESGAMEKPSLHDGRVFTANARQLIEFVAEASGLIVEFRQRRRKQLSDEQRDALRQRMAKINSANGKLSTDNGDFPAQISTPASNPDSWEGVQP